VKVAPCPGVVLEGLSGHTDVLEEQAPPPAPTKWPPGLIS
jgi:hypothetical protein